MKPVSDIVIFLGPTMPLEEANQILEAIYLPPVRCCDLISVIHSHEPKVIGIIDGVFDQSAPIRHKEIMYALDLGIKVYGASSMGALRASETDTYGMIGIGEIYRMYSQGELEDDDEVALVHATASMGYKQLSEPMVNLRQTFKLAVTNGIIDEKTFHQLLLISKGIYYQQRTLPTIFQKAVLDGIPQGIIESLVVFFRENYVDLKRQDATLLLETIRDLSMPFEDVSRKFNFVSTPAFTNFYKIYRKVYHRNTEVSISDIYDHTALNTKDFAAIKNQAINRKIALVLAEFLEIQASADEIESQSNNFLSINNIHSEESFFVWLKNNDINHKDFTVLMYELVLYDKLCKWLSNRRNIKAMVLNELRLQNRYEGLAAETANKARIIQDYHPYIEEMANENFKTEYLFANHMHQTNRPLENSYRDWLTEADFPDAFYLRMELLRSKLARQTVEDIALRASKLFIPEDTL
jgi:hypothetical protein